MVSGVIRATGGLFGITASLVVLITGSVMGRFSVYTGASMISRRLWCSGRRIQERPGPRSSGEPTPTRIPGWSARDESGGSALEGSLGSCFSVAVFDHNLIYGDGVDVKFGLNLEGYIDSLLLPIAAADGRRL